MKYGAKEQIKKTGWPPYHRAPRAAETMEAQPTPPYSRQKSLWNLVRLLWLEGPGSSVGIATGYGLDGPGIESRWGRGFPPVQTGPGAHQASCTMGTGSFPGVKCGRGVLLTTHPLLAPRSWKGSAIPLPPLWATTRPVTELLYFYSSPAAYSSQTMYQEERGFVPHLIQSH